jgi:hypothetical protein
LGLRARCGGRARRYAEKPNFAHITLRVRNAGREDWFRDLDSNQDTQLQRLMSYQLDDPGIAKKL